MSLTTNSAIPEGAYVLVNYRWSGMVLGFRIFTRNALIAFGGAINTSGKGCRGGIGIRPGSAGGTQSTNRPYSFTPGGGGGGGRIAVYADTNYFAGMISALGGMGA